MVKIKTTVIPDQDDPTTPLKSPTGKIVRRPLLRVELMGLDGDSLFDTQALVDSGADLTMINAGYALELGIDLSRVPDIDAKGIYHEPVKVKPAEVTIRFTDLKIDITLPALFIYSENVNVLLGREGFFDLFNVKFRIDADFFEIKPVNGLGLQAKIQSVPTEKSKLW